MFVFVCVLLLYPITHIASHHTCFHSQILQFKTGGEFITIVDDGASPDRTNGVNEAYMREDSNNNNNIRALATITRRILRYNPHLSNVTRLVNISAAAGDGGVIWWKNKAAFDTTEANATEVDQIMFRHVSKSVKGGKFEKRLRSYIRQLVAVRPPGLEGQRIEIIDGDDDEPPPVLVDGHRTTTERSSWDTRQWIGLGMFGTTLLWLLIMTTAAQVRRYKLQQEETWKLSTEHDMNLLLQYGWHVSQQTADGRHGVHVYQHRPAQESRKKKNKTQRITTAFNNSHNNESSIADDSVLDNDSLLLGRVVEAYAPQIIPPSSSRRGDLLAAQEQPPKRFTITSARTSFAATSNSNSTAGLSSQALSSLLDASEKT